MNDFGARLDREIGELPKSTVDVDAVIARERLRFRLRRAGAAGAAITAVTGIAVGAVALLGVTAPSGLPSDGGARGVVTTTSRPAGCPPAARPSPTPSPSPWVTDTAPTASPPPWSAPVLPAGAGPRLTAALKAAVRAAAGSPPLAATQWGGMRRPLEFNAGPCDPNDPSDYFAAAAVLTRTRPSVRLGDFFVQVTRGATGPGFRTSCAAPEENEIACTASRGPRGETVVAVTWHGDRQGRPPATWHDVTIMKPDGAVVTLHAGGAGPAHPTPPFTVAQLTEIGLDPRLTLG